MLKFNIAWNTMFFFPPHFPENFLGSELCSRSLRGKMLHWLTGSPFLRNKAADNFEECWSESENKLKPGVCPDVTEMYN